MKEKSLCKSSLLLVLINKNNKINCSKRIIPCLDIKNGETVKGINFVDLRSAGDPVELAKQYVIQGADELVFLDITSNCGS